MKQVLRLGALAILVAAAAQAAEITLADALAHAHGHSPAAAAAEATYIAARADLWQGWGNVLPTATLGYNAQRYYDREVVRLGGYQIPGYTPPLHYYYASGSASQPLFAGGALIWGVLSGRAAARAGAASREGQLRQLDVDVVRAYCGVLKAEGLKRVAETSLEAGKRAEELARAQFETETISRAEYLQAKVALGQARTGLIAAEAAAETARLSFFNAAGMTPDAAATFAAAELPAPRELASLDELIGAAMAQRPDVTRVAAERRKADLAVRSARAGWFPTVGATASYDWSYQDPPARENWDPNASWTVGLAASWDVFDGLKTPANVGRARAAALTAHSAHERIRDAVALDVTRAYYEYKKQRETLAVAEETAAAAEEEFSLTRRLYELGGVSTTDFTQAQSRYLEAQTGLVAARFDLLVADWDLSRALGEKR